MQCSLFAALAGAFLAGAAEAGAAAFLLPKNIWVEEAAATREVTAAPLKVEAGAKAAAEATRPANTTLFMMALGWL